MRRLRRDDVDAVPVALFAAGAAARNIDQWLAFAVLMLGYWAAFAHHPLPPPDFDYAKVGVPLTALTILIGIVWLQTNG